VGFLCFFIKKNSKMTWCGRDHVGLLQQFECRYSKSILRVPNAGELAGSSRPEMSSNEILSYVPSPPLSFFPRIFLFQEQNFDCKYLKVYTKLDGLQI